MLYPLIILALGSVTAASWAGNLNYRSPSHHHPSLGVSIHKVNKRNGGSSPIAASSLNFTHGVASGDPFANSVIIWTRCAPMLDDVADNSTTSGYVPLYNPVPIYDDTDEGKPPSTSPVCLQYKVGTDKALKNVVDSGTAFTSSDVDYTLKVSLRLSSCLKFRIGRLYHHCLSHFRRLLFVIKFIDSQRAIILHWALFYCAF